jgi:hypothetical protein
MIEINESQRQQSSWVVMISAMWLMFTARLYASLLWLSLLFLVVKNVVATRKLVQDPRLVLHPCPENVRAAVAPKNILVLILGSEAKGRGDEGERWFLNQKIHSRSAGGRGNRTTHRASRQERR